ncbi:YdcF family protein [Haloechinothrix halophila]|uniref:YdcF family protein n=1 Tax=Haloechinothrix halophila TaxID=1069073 RepID=UPI0004276C39|nr:YdcF family protein [Haloechinothrix halophila]
MIAESREPRFRRWLLRAVVGGILVGLVLVTGTAFRIWQVARVDDRSPADLIVVLGAAQYNGTPSDIFRWRLEHARDLYQDGVARYVVTTGGSRDGDAYTEAEAGARWLERHGVPASATIAIGEGVDTLGSIEAAGVEARERGLESAVVVSDPWHSLRARTMAKDSGLDAWTSPTRSGPTVQTREIQFRYIWRETKALLFYRVARASADEAGSTGLG